MFNPQIKPYRFNNLEWYLLNKTQKIFIDSGYSLYRWPEVYFGNFNNFPPTNIDFDEKLDGDINSFDMDYLGLYVYNSKTEGHIRIFIDRIIKCAERIANSLNLNKYQTVNDLLAIVIIHEIGHWLTHSCHSNNKQIRLRSFSSQEKVIKESMAQLTVVWSIMKSKNDATKRLKIVFDYLVERQSYPYKAFRELGTKETHVKKLLKRYGYISDDYLYNFGYDFNYLIHGDKIYKKS